MILQFSFRVGYDDGRTFEVTTNARDQFAFERHHGASILDLLPGELLRKIGITSNGNGTAPEGLTAADARVETGRFAWLAWHALHRTGQEPGDFDAFSDRLINLGIAGMGQPVPTQPAPVSGS